VQHQTTVSNAHDTDWNGHCTWDTAWFTQTVVVFFTRQPLLQPRQQNIINVNSYQVNSPYSRNKNLKLANVLINITSFHYNFKIDRQSFLVTCF